MLRIAKFILIAGLLYTGCKNSQNVDWGSYQGDLTASQYSSLDQINKANIDGLKVAWRYQSGDADRANRTQIQCNPLIIDGILYGTSPTLKLFALDATTGHELWRYDPFGNKYDQFGMGVNRGVHFWTDGKDSRILTTAGQYLYAVDANKGSLIRSFGEDGLVDLRDGLSRNVGNNYISSNTPGVIYKDLLILGSRVSESTGPVPGHIRAYNVRTQVRSFGHLKQFLSRVNSAMKLGPKTRT